MLDVATRSGKLLPSDEAQRSLAICWLFAALNSIEPPFANLAEVDFFIDDEEMKAKRRPGVIKAVNAKLDQLAAALGPRAYLVGDDFRSMRDVRTALREGHEVRFEGSKLIFCRPV